MSELETKPFRMKNILNKFVRMKCGLGLVFLLIGLAVTPAQSKELNIGLLVQFENSLDQTEINQKAVTELFQESLKKLPPEVSGILSGSKVLLNFVTMDELSEIPVPTCKNGEQELRTNIAADFIYKSKRSKYEILLNRNLLKDIAQGPSGSRTYLCGHRSLYRLAVASVIHEVGHIYDFLNIPATSNSDEKTFRDFCDRSMREDPYIGLPARCHALNKEDRSVSDRLDFLHLLGWDAGVFSTQNKNKLFARSPDPYEFDSPAESFAVNFEFFLLDPEFACRRPATYQYLSTHFKFDPYPNRNCSVNYDVPLSGKPLMYSIDPERVYQIHYLLAGKGTDLSSRWGHAMFRVVLCKPGRAVGPDCMKDIAHHVVLSYRANISDLVIDTLKGLFGGYPSQLFLFLMTEIVEEYNVGESRDLYSFPIKMDRSQITQFIHKTLEQTWQYQGKYFFIGNNCATESMHFLQGIVPDYELQMMAPILQTPNGVYEALSERGLLDEVAMTGSNNVGRYFFPGFFSRLTPKFEELKKLTGFPVDLNIEIYLSEYSAVDRLALFTGVLLQSRANRTQLASRFLYLEMAVREHLRQKLMKESGKFVQGEIRDDLGEEVFEKMIQKMREIHARILPWKLLTNGYGVPLSHELISRDEFVKRVVAYNDEFLKIMELVKKKVPGPYRDLDDVKLNIEALQRFAIQ